MRLQNQAGDNPKRWNNTGIIVECKGFNQYLVKNDGRGRLTLRKNTNNQGVAPHTAEIWRTLPEKNVPCENYQHGKDMFCDDNQGVALHTAETSRTLPEKNDASPGPSSGLDCNTFVRGWLDDGVNTEVRTSDQ